MKRKQVDSSRWVSRVEAAALMKVSVRTVRELEARKLITPMKMAGKVYIKREELAGVALRRHELTTGAKAALLFQEFRGGKSFDQIIIDHQIDPAIVRELFYEWKTSLEEGYQRDRTRKALTLKEVQAMRAQEKEKESRARERHELALAEKELAIIRGDPK